MTRYRLLFRYESRIVHRSVAMTLVFLAAAWLAGLVLGILADARPMALLLLFAASLPLGLLFRLNRRPVMPIAMMALLLLAWWRVEATEQPVPELTVQESQPVTVAGWIGNDPEMVGASVRFVLIVDTVDRGQGPTQLPLPSRVMVYAQPPDDLAQRRPPPFFLLRRPVGYFRPVDASQTRSGFRLPGIPGFQGHIRGAWQPGSGG